jgi:HSP20 family protein
MRTLVKTNGNIFPNVPSLFDDLFTRDIFHHPFMRREEETLPLVNIHENNDGYEIEVAAPGMEKGDFSVEINNNVLVINANRTSQVEDKGDDYRRKEFNYQQFQRSFRLPETQVNQDNVSAKYNDGILHISVPKKEKEIESPSKKIEIS